jgi:hypothetical protein
MNEFLFQVDPSIEEALAEERGCHVDLAADLMRGHHAKLVVRELNDLKARKALNCGEQIMPAGDFEWKLLAALHGPGFHTIAQQEGTYDIWDPDQSDYLTWMQKRHPEARVRNRTGRTMITNQFKPPTL